MSGEKNKLTDNQAAFVNQYIIDFNGTRAAIDAGYAKGSAAVASSRLLRNANIMQAVQSAIMSRVKRVHLDQDYVIQGLIELAERCMQRAPVMVRDGKRMVQATDEEDNHIWQFNHQGAAKAFELLGKHLGIFIENINLHVEDDLASRISRGRNRTTEDEQQPVRH